MFRKKKKYPKKSKKVEIPSELALVCGKVDRSLAKNINSVKLDNLSIKTSFYIETPQIDREFNDSDWIIIDDKRIRGFNFDSTDEIVNYLKIKKGAGQYQVFAEDTKGDTKIVWEGLIFPNKILKNN